MNIKLTFPVLPQRSLCLPCLPVSLLETMRRRGGHCVRRDFLQRHERLQDR